MKIYSGPEKRRDGEKRTEILRKSPDFFAQAVTQRIRQEIMEGATRIVLSADITDTGLTSTEFATMLRNIRDTVFAPFGYLMTFHRKFVPGGEHAESTAPDIGGVPYPAATLNLQYENPTLITKQKIPIDPAELHHIELRKLPHGLGPALQPHTSMYEKLQVEGKLGFGHPETGLIHAYNMVVASSTDGAEYDMWTVPLSELSVHPNMQALHYGGSLFEGMSAEWGKDGNCYVFGIQNHWERYARGCKRLGITPLPFKKFEEVIVTIVQQNVAMIPPNGRLYLRPHAADSGPQMRVGNSHSSAFYVEVTPVGSAESYFGEVEKNENGHVKGKGLIVPTTQVRSTPGLGGYTKVVGNYALTTVLIREAKKLNIGTEREPHHPVGVLFANTLIQDKSPAEMRAVEIKETNASNVIFFQKIDDERWRLITPSRKAGDILPGNQLALIIEMAQRRGWEVEERPVTLGEIMDGAFDAAANCGTASVISPFDWIQLAEFRRESDAPDSDWRAELIIGTQYKIREQDKIDNESIPPPVKILLGDVLAVKSARSSEEDTKRYLTKVPGIRKK